MNNLLYGQHVEPLNQHIGDKLSWAMVCTCRSQTWVYVFMGVWVYGCIGVWEEVTV